MTQEEKKQQEVERTHNVPVFTPEVDIYEKDKALTVIADMPGVEQDTVDVNFEKGVLTIKGRVTFQAPENYRALHQEFKIGEFERSFTVPEQIDIEKIEAKVKDGVLNITLPFLPKPGPKKIVVQAG